MSVITVWNKGRRTWKAGQVRGLVADLEPQSSAEMEEVDGLRFIAAYPREITQSGIAGPSASDLKRREQSIHDREKNLDEREKDIEAREKALEDKPKRGRPAKAKDEGNEPEDE